jgi:diadenosine tetraphosphate (Ap4A) HIT family hydrolase
MAEVRTAFLLLISALAAGAATECDCDPARPETLKVRQCSLCNEAERQPADVTVFFLKDINPRKPNRWLALPKRHGSGMHHLHDLSKSDRTALWKTAIAKAKEMWGNEWGVAYNGEKVRTQCHTHVHIGRMLPHVETNRFITIRRAEQIPAPPGEGLWIHGLPDGRMHVHLGEQTAETVLMR